MLKIPPLVINSIPQCFFSLGCKHLSFPRVVSKSNTLKMSIFFAMTEVNCPTFVLQTLESLLNYPPTHTRTHFPKHTQMCASTQILKRAQAQVCTHKYLTQTNKTHAQFTPDCRGQAGRLALNLVGKFKCQTVEPLRALNSYT